MGKGEIAHNEQFLFFPQCFLLDQIIVSPFVHICDIISLFAAESAYQVKGKSFSNDKFLDLSKFKAFADNKQMSNETEIPFGMSRKNF